MATKVWFTEEEASALRVLLEAEVSELGDTEDPGVRNGEYRRELASALVRIEQSHGFAEDVGS